MNNVTSFKAKDLSEPVGSINKSTERCSLYELKTQGQAYKYDDIKNSEALKNEMSYEEIRDKAKRSIKKHFQSQETLDNSGNNKVPDSKPNYEESKNDVQDNKNKDHMAYKVQGLIDWAAEWALENGLVDKYIQVNKKSRQVSFDHKSFDNDQLLAKKQSSKNREKELKNIAKEMNNMDFKIPNSEAVKDFHTMMELSKNNPNLEVSKMNSQQKVFNKNVLKPMMTEISENNMLGKGLNSKKVSGIYNKHRKEGFLKELKDLVSKVFGFNK